MQIYQAFSHIKLFTVRMVYLETVCIKYTIYNYTSGCIDFFSCRDFSTRPFPECCAYMYIYIYYATTPPKSTRVCRYMIVVCVSAQTRRLYLPLYFIAIFQPLQTDNQHVGLYGGGVDLGQNRMECGAYIAGLHIGGTYLHYTAVVTHTKIDTYYTILYCSALCVQKRETTTTFRAPTRLAFTF